METQGRLVRGWNDLKREYQNYENKEELQNEIRKEMRKNSMTSKTYRHYQKEDTYRKSSLKPVNNWSIFGDDGENIFTGTRGVAYNLLHYLDFYDKVSYTSVRNG